MEQLYLLMETKSFYFKTNCSINPTKKEIEVTNSVSKTS